jgi:hypothetical protein
VFGNYPQLIFQVIAQSLIFYILSLLFGIYLPFVLYPTVLVSIREISNYINKKHSSEVGGDEAQEFADKIAEKCSIQYVELGVTTASSGILVPKFFRKDTILIPENTNPSQLTEDVKVVIAHEIAHINYRDSLRSLLVAALYVISVNTIFYVYPNLIFGVLCIFILATYPIVFNYFSHRQEFRADEFAGKIVSKESVISRLSRNSHLSDGGSLTHTHPSISERISRLHSTTQEN